MENPLINVLIVDDEKKIVRGRNKASHRLEQSWLLYLRRSCKWGGSPKHDKAFYDPGLVLLDIRTPKLYGTDLIAKVREDGFEGDFIILSGYTDFSYAQTALHYGASFYLTKPIDENELINSVLAVKEKNK